MAHHRSRRLLTGAVLVLAAAACAGDGGNRAEQSPTSTQAVVTSTVVSTTAVTPSAPSTTTGPPLRWVALGDSYSAGIGASTPEQKVSTICERDPVGNYPVLAADTLARQGRPVELDVRSCDGATIRQIIDTQSAGAANADVITLTLGGNDFGFSRVLADCLGRGCRSYDQPDARFPGFAHEDGRSDWEVLEQRVMDALVGFAPQLAPGGQVFVLTYPLPFPAQPDETCIKDSAPMNDVSRYLANAAIERLDAAILTAVTKANAAAPRPYITVVEWRTGLDRPLRPTTDASGVDRMIRDNPNGICSPEPMLNGIARTEFGDSFHPTDRGLSFAADALATAITKYAATR